MISVFILCAGDGERWGNYLNIPKQLISFGEETIIDRTARLVHLQIQKNICLYCVTRNSNIALSHHGSLYIPPTNSLIETILSTHNYWTNQNIFLLGDVFYSQEAILKIIKCNRDYCFFGRPWSSSYVNCGHGEMFGLSFTSSFSERMHNILINENTSKPKSIDGNLWYLYQRISGLPLGSSKYLPLHLIPIDDYTNDIDGSRDYMRRKKLYTNISCFGEKAIFLKIHYLTLYPKHLLRKIIWRLKILIESQKLKDFSDY